MSYGLFINNTNKLDNVKKVAVIVRNLKNNGAALKSQNTLPKLWWKFRVCLHSR